MATDSDILEFNRSLVVIKPPAFPAFPKLPDRIRQKFPDLVPEWGKYDEATKQFVIQLQNILRFGGSTELRPVTPTTPPLQPPGQQGNIPGPQGAQGNQGFQGFQGSSTPVNTMDDEALVLATVAV